MQGWRGVLRQLIRVESVARTLSAAADSEYGIVWDGNLGTVLRTRVIYDAWILGDDIMCPLLGFCLDRPRIPGRVV